MQKTRQFITMTSMIFTASVFLLVGCSKKSNEKTTSASDDKNYVVSEDFDEDAFIAEMMAENRSDETNGKFIASDIDESIFESCVVPDLSLFKYELNKTGNGLIITEYSGTDIENLKFPEEIEGFPVVELELSLNRHEEVKVLMIPDSVKKLGNSAFFNWTGLEHIHLPASLEVIEDSVFDGCTSLQELVIPNGVKRIEEAFGLSYENDSNKIRFLSIPESVTELGNRAFKNCYYLEEIKLPSSLSNLPEGIFKNCYSLKEIEIPNTVTSIPDEAFLGCISLNSVIIPESVTEIGKKAFAGCNSLEELTIPNSVITIKGEAFGLYEKPYEAKFIEPFLDMEIGNYIGIKSLVIPDSVENIETYTFEGLTKLEFLKLPNSLKKIEYGLFNDGFKSTLKSLKTIELSSSCEEIGDKAFVGLTSLEEIVIPESLAHINFEGRPFSDTKLSLKTQARLRQLGYEGDF